MKLGVGGIRCYDSLLSFELTLDYFQPLALTYVVKLLEGREEEMKEKRTPKPPDKVAKPSQGQGLISASHWITNIFPHLKKSM